MSETIKCCYQFECEAIDEILAPGQPKKMDSCIFKAILKDNETLVSSNTGYKIYLAEITMALDDFSSHLFEVYPDKFGKYDYLDYGPDTPGRFIHYLDMVMHWWHNEHNKPKEKK